MQSKVTELARTAAKTGVAINKAKTKVMHISNLKEDCIVLDGEKLEEVSSSTYLGSVIGKDGGADKDIQMRIGKARTAFIMLKPIGNSKNISAKTKLCILILM